MIVETNLGGIPTEQAAYQLIERALADPLVFRSLLEASYLHPNGFAKIPLIRDQDGTVIRLHYWRGGVLQDTNIHSHRWDMSSRILRGIYRARDFEESQDGLSVDKFQCAENRNGSYALDLVERTFLRLVTNRTFRPGDHYNMAAGLIHLVDEVLTYDAISLVNCSPIQFTHSWVYSPQNEVPFNVPSQPIDTSILEWILGQAREELCALQGH